MNYTQILKELKNHSVGNLISHSSNPCIDFDIEGSIDAEGASVDSQYCLVVEKDNITSYSNMFLNRGEGPTEDPLTKEQINKAIQDLKVFEARVLNILKPYGLKPIDFSKEYNGT